MNLLMTIFKYLCIHFLNHQFRLGDCKNSVERKYGGFKGCILVLANFVSMTSSWNNQFNFRKDKHVWENLISVFENYRNIFRVCSMIRHRIPGDLGDRRDFLAIEYLHIHFSVRTLVPVSDIMKRKSIVESKSELGTSV